MGNTRRDKRSRSSTSEDKRPKKRTLRAPSVSVRDGPGRGSIGLVGGGMRGNTALVKRSVDMDINRSFFNTQVPLCLNPIAQGNGPSQRLGAEQVVLKSIHIKGHLILDAAADGFPTGPERPTARRRIDDYGELWVFQAPTRHLPDADHPQGFTEYHPPVRDIALLPPQPATHDDHVAIERFARKRGGFRAIGN